MPIKPKTAKFTYWRHKDVRRQSGGANRVELRMGEPERPKVQTDASNACTHTQSVAKESQRPTNKSERVSRPQTDQKKTKLTW